jgi:hypothetical protein
MLKIKIFAGLMSQWAIYKPSRNAKAFITDLMNVAIFSEEKCFFCVIYMDIWGR